VICLLIFCDLVNSIFYLTIFSPTVQQQIIGCQLFVGQCFLFQGLFADSNPASDELAEWILNVILKPSTNLMEAYCQHDHEWHEKECFKNDLTNFRVTNAITTSIIGIYSTHGFIVYPINKLKDTIPKLHAWLTDAKLSERIELSTKVQAGRSVTNVPIVLGVIGLLLRNRVIVANSLWSKSIKKDQNAYYLVKSKEELQHAKEYREIFKVKFDCTL
jgi:hypothetical protein